MNNIEQTSEHLFREEAGKMLAVLIRLFGLRQVSVAEDIVQETLLAALESWKLRGIPEQPRAWLYRTAKNKTIDWLRREQNFRDNIAPNYIRQTDTESGRWLDQCFLDHEIEDAQLRTMFACCHPAISAEYQLVLTLRTLCGLSVREIAIVLMQPEDTIGKRLTRAKDKLRTATLDVPTGAELTERLDVVLQAIYLLFNEGYKSATAHTVIRRELCEEALRLGGILTRHPITNQPRSHALQSLMCFHAARFDTRVDEQGHIILLEDQDRSRWNRPMITVAYQHLKLASVGSEITEYHIEAAIASYHAAAPTFGQTNWKAIYYCYELLYKINPSPFVALNRAIALGYADGPPAGIEALLQISELSKNQFYHTALGDFYRLTGQTEAAQAAYRQALSLAVLPAESAVIERKLGHLSI